MFYKVCVRFLPYNLCVVLSLGEVDLVQVSRASGGPVCATVSRAATSAPTK